MSTRRYALASFATGGHIYAAGNCGAYAEGSVERYNADTDSWSPVAAMATARTFAPAAVVGAVGGDMDLFESAIAKVTRARR